jgi:hypothetical protein
VLHGWRVRERVFNAVVLVDLVDVPQDEVVVQRHLSVLSDLAFFHLVYAHFHDTIDALPGIAPAPGLTDGLPAHM